MQEHLLQILTLKLTIGLEDSMQKFVSGRLTQVELPVMFRIPWPIFAEEDNSISCVEKHLCGTTCSLITGKTLHSSKSNADIADAIPCRH